MPNHNIYIYIEREREISIRLHSTVYDATLHHAARRAGPKSCYVCVMVSVNS